MVSLDRRNWRPLIMAQSDARAIVNLGVDVGHVIREAARHGRLAQLEEHLDALENRHRREKHSTPSDKF